MNAQAKQLNVYHDYEYYELKTGTVKGVLEVSGNLRTVDIGWSLLGDSSKPIIVVLGGISSNRDVAFDGLLDRCGWWEKFVGKNKAIDTEKFAVLSFDYLGGCTTTKFVNQEKPEQTITTATQANVLKLLISKLGIEKLYAVVGSSYGGMVSLAFSELFPEYLTRQIVISAADRSHPRSTALRQIQRGIVRFGVENGNINQGLSLARQLGMITYRSKAEFFDRYDSDNIELSHESLKSYLLCNGEKFAQKFNYKAFLCLSESIDTHQITPQNISTPTQLISVDSDELIFADQLELFSQNIRAKVALTNISSNYGHDAFLKEHHLLKPIIQSALEAEYV